VQKVVFGRWQLDCNPVLTRQKYSLIISGAPESCGCAPCRNFAAARTHIYTSDVLRLFEELGIAANREAEVYHNCRIAPGQHNYGGWFHFIGRIASGADASRLIAQNVWTFDLEETTERFKVGFTHRIGLLNKTFEGCPVVQVEFQAIVPWVLVRIRTPILIAADDSLA
jgi:hypothetical protein